MNRISPAYDRSSSPLYVQVASVMRHRIEKGIWSKGDKISTLDELEKEFNVARVTIRQAIDILRSEGLLVAQQGRGTFVSGSIVQNRWLNLATDFDQLVNIIRDNVIKRVKVNPSVDSPPLAPDEGSQASSYAFIRSVQYNNKMPFSVVNLYLDKDIFSRDAQSFEKSAALPKIVKMPDIQIKHAYQTLTIGVADPETSRLLNIGLGEPTANCRLVLVDSRGVAVYVAEIQYLQDCFAMRLDLLGAKASKSS